MRVVRYTGWPRDLCVCVSVSLNKASCVTLKLVLLSLQHCWSIQNERRIICIPSCLSSVFLCCSCNMRCSDSVVACISLFLYLCMHVCVIHIMLSLSYSASGSPLQWVNESDGWPDLLAYPMLYQSTPLFFSSPVHSCHYCTVFLVIRCKVLT